MMTSPNYSSPATEQTKRLGTSVTSGSSIAQTVIARDLSRRESDCLDGPDNESRSLRRKSSNLSGTTPNSLAGSYNRPSSFIAGFQETVVHHAAEQGQHLPREAGEQVFEEGESLVHNNILTSRELAGQSGYGNSQPHQSAEHDPRMPSCAPTETTALLAGQGPRGDGAEFDRKWEDAVGPGQIQTNWRREAKIIGNYTLPLIVTFVLQYSLTVASIFAVGHLGTVELAAVSLASMTVGITGSAVYQGLATSLDTLCAQAYGSGKKALVGLQMQRMMFFLWTVTIPIAVIWFLADKILSRIVPETEVALLAGQYLKVLILGMPGLAAFESGKRFVQAQGIFTASLYVLLVCAPLNAFMNWFFVWQLGWGFVGAPIAVVITDYMMPSLLFLYVYFVRGRECWNGFTWRAFENWGPMVRLAVPGLIMVEAEYLAFELLTLTSSFFGTEALAAQSILSTITSITFQIPFPLSIASSTRVANLIGAMSVDAARTAAKVSLVGAAIVGLFNVTLLSSLRNSLPQLFSSDEEVISIAAGVLPLCAAFQLFDALAAACNGILRGLGRQKVGGYVQVFCYYVIAMPISMGTAFGLGWSLIGLWTGVAIALCLVFVIEISFLSRTSWQKSVEDARKRNEMA
ncbi:hypothetical protein VTN31DRAFT_3318 [Thermomyces dupontii]|uniref:uncharacterized protein n=1 Tax=Talaromyces thermophilus TaxID=28565 RepID=UPI0037437F47